MRLLLVADAIGESELEETPSWLASLATRLAARGHRVTALCAAAPEPWRSVGDPPGVVVWRPELDTLERAFSAALANFPDVVHLAATGPLPPRVTESLAALPLVIDAHDMGAVCPAGDLRLRPAQGPCPHQHPHEACGACAGLKRIQAASLREPLVASAALVVTHTRLVTTRLAERMDREVLRIPLGVDPLRFHPSPPASALTTMLEPRTRPRALLLGSATTGPVGPGALDVLVSLTSRVPDAELVIAGRDARDPDAQARLLAEARRMGLLANLRLLPRVEWTDLPVLFASSDVAIALEATDQFAGLSVMRALASALPVVAPAGAPFEEWIEDGREGRLVEPRAAALAEAAAVFMASAPLRAGFGERARLAAIERHDLERAVVAHEEAYVRARRDTRPARAA